MPPGEHEHEHAEAFPRIETAELVGGSIAAETRRRRIQVALVAVGITAIALGLPTEPVIGRTMELVGATVRGEWTGLHLVPSILARGLTAIAPLSAERAWFLVSALGLGASAAVLLALARRRAFPAFRSTLATLLAVSAPVVWLAGTTPSAASCGLFGACMLFAALDGGAKGGDVRSARRAALAWSIAALLHPWNVLLWPALALAELHRKRLVLAFAALASWILIVGGAFVLEHGAQALPLLMEATWRTLLAGGSGGPGPLLAWGLAWIPGLCVAMTGFALAVKTWHNSGRRPPAWTLAFALVPLAVLGLGGVVTFDIPYLWLVPIAFLGLLEITSVVVLLVLLATATLALPAFTSLDEDAAFQREVPRRLESTDLVLAATHEHAYLLVQRYGLDVVDLSVARTLARAPEAAFWDIVAQRAAEARSAQRRVVIDARWEGGVSGGWILLDDPHLAHLRDLGAVDFRDLPSGKR